MAKSYPAKSHPIDVHIGRRLRQRRTLLGMSQSGLGAAMGVTFQQVQKYEHGANRSGATQLFEVSRVLDVPISFFFEDAGALSFKSRERKTGSPMNDRETLHLVRDFFRIRDPRVRLNVARMVKAIAQPAPLVGRTLSRQDTGQADIVIPGVGIVSLDEARWSKVRTAGVSGPSPAATNDEP
jgi:transcriptional regulator with XRE-family HTH domain